jgi:hypothetical protein
LLSLSPTISKTFMQMFGSCSTFSYDFKKSFLCRWLSVALSTISKTFMQGWLALGFLWRFLKLLCRVGLLSAFSDDF